MSGLPRTPREARRSHLESAFWRRLLVGGVRRMPLWLQQATMPLWSAFFYSQVPHVRRAISANLDRLGGYSEESLRLRLRTFRTFTNYCSCVASAYRFYGGSRPPAPYDKVGVEKLRAALREGRGAILVTGHIGNWQVGPYMLARDGFPAVTVVMAEEPDAGAQQIEQQLRDRQLRVVYSGRAPLLALELRAALRRGELVAMQIDRPTRGRGLRVPFAGGQAEFARGPAELARACSVPVVPVFFPLIDGRPRICVERPLYCRHTDDAESDVRELTELLARIYAAYVRSYPEQWYNFYAFWTDTEQTRR